MTIVEFLLARLDEDERIARGAIRWSEGATEWATPGEPDHDHIARHDPARVLREVKAKRRIVERHEPSDHETDYTDADGDEHTVIECVECFEEEHPCPTLRLLASVYADHPDYEPEWRSES